MRATAVSFDRDWLSVVWEDGGKTRHFAAWLRDNSPAPDARHPVNGQRLFDIASLDGAIAIKGAWLERDGAIGMILAPDGHQTRFDYALLRSKASQVTTRFRLPDQPFSATWLDVREYPAQRLAWLSALSEEGMALLTGLPGDEAAGAEVIALFGYPRETNYGRSFAVVTKSDPNNLAFSDAALGPHSDNPYRDPVPGLQLLHCLVNDAEGGQSLFVDGFQVAEQLRAMAPDDFALLTRHEIPFRFRDAEVDLKARQTLIQLDGEGRVSAIHYNNRSAAAFDLPEAVLPDFYRAYRSFGSLLQAPELQLRLTLEAGQLVAFDNRRILHGRTAIEGGGDRRLVGWYADRDGLRSQVIKLREAAAG